MEQIALPAPLDLTPPPMPEDRRRAPRDPAAPFLGALIGSLILVCCAILFLLMTSNWGHQKDQTAFLPEASHGANRHAVDEWAAAPPQAEPEPVAQEPAAAPDSGEESSHPDQTAAGAEPSIASPQPDPTQAPADETASVMPAAPSAGAEPAPAAAPADPQQMDAKSLEATGADLDDTAPAPDQAVGTAAARHPAEKVAAEHGTTVDSADGTESASAPEAAAVASKDASASQKVARLDSRQEAASRPAKPRWKPMTVGTPATSGGSYDSKVWAALAHHRPHVGQGGSAVVSFAVGPAGGLRGVRIHRSSGNSRLDQMAVAAVRSAAPFPAPPLGSGPRTYSIQIFFR